MWASSPTKCLPIGFRRAACPHAAVMVRWLSGGGLRAALPTGGLQEVRWGGDTRACHPTRTFVGQGPCALPWVREGNPPVSALPCQPPLGKGALGTGVRIATTSDIGHWFRNDMGFCKRCSFVRRKYHDSIYFTTRSFFCKRLLRSFLLFFVVL